MRLVSPLLRRHGGEDFVEHNDLLPHHDFGDILLPFFLGVSILAGADASLSLLILVPMLGLALLGVVGSRFNLFQQSQPAALYTLVRAITFAAIVLWILLSALEDTETFSDVVDTVAICEEETTADQDLLSWLELAGFLVFFVGSLVAQYWQRIYHHVLPARGRRWFRLVFVHRLGWVDNIPGPTADEVIDALEVVQITSEGGECCSVCLEDFAPGDLANKLRCQHVFHANCVLPWLRMKNTCPVCRACVDSSSSPSPPRAATTATTTPTSSSAAWACLERIADPPFALDYRSETVSTLMFLPAGKLVERALQTAVAVPLSSSTAGGNAIARHLARESVHTQLGKHRVASWLVLQLNKRW